MSNVAAQVDRLVADRDAMAVELANMAVALEARDDLIRWLALPYAGDPVFNTREDVLVPGHNPAHRDRLQQTWREVIGERRSWAGMPGRLAYWDQCLSCGMWSIHNSMEVPDDRPDNPSP